MPAKPLFAVMLALIHGIATVKDAVQPWDGESLPEFPGVHACTRQPQLTPDAVGFLLTIKVQAVPLTTTVTLW